MLTPARIASACEALVGVGTSVEKGRLSFGVTDIPGPGQTCWATVEFTSRTIRFEESPTTLPSETLPVGQDEHDVLAIRASEDSWRRIGGGGLDAVRQAVDEGRVELAGDLPYFIRHMRDVLRLAEHFAASL